MSDRCSVPSGRPAHNIRIDNSVSGQQLTPRMTEDPESQPRDPYRPDSGSGEHSEKKEESRLNSGLMGNMPFLEHLEELRWRLLKSVLAVIVMSGAAFYFSDQLVYLIKKPLGGEIKLYNIAVTGAFYAYLKIAIVAGVMGALPVIFYQMWSFISPGLYKREKLAILPLVAISTLLFVIGAGFCYIMVLPLAFEFLIGFGGDLIVNTITIGSYISFVGLLMITFGFGFQMPILAYFLGKMGIIKARMLAKGRRYALVTMLVAGAIITPPDVFTQVLLAVPLYLLYEISIIVVRVVQRKKKEAALADEAADSLPYRD